jgi:hypothetical protein
VHTELPTAEPYPRDIQGAIAIEVANHRISSRRILRSEAQLRHFGDALRRIVGIGRSIDEGELRSLR